MNRALPYLLIVFFYLALHGVLVALGLSPVLRGEMGDTDAYMRALQAERLAEDPGSWFTAFEPRLNDPEGYESNWTRPLDVLLVAGSLPLVIYAGFEWREAIYWTGVWLPPFLHVLLGLALAWAAAPLLTAPVRPLVMLMGGLVPVMIAYNLAGRPDQQTLLLIAIVLMTGWATRALVCPQGSLRAGLYAGLCAGFGLWLTVEAQFSFLLLTGLLGLVWLERGNIRVLETLEGLALGFLIMVAGALLIERGGDWSGARELDRISLSHALGAIVNVGLWGFLATTARYAHAMGRIVLGGLWAGLALGGLIFFAPELLQGPAGGIDPRVLQDFFLNIREMRPLWPHDAEQTSLMLLWLGVPLLALPLWGLTRPVNLLAWLPVAGLTAGFTILAFFHARFAQVAVPLGCILLVYAGEHFSQRQAGRWRRIFSCAGLLLAPLLAGLAAVASMPEGKPAPSCSVAAIRKELATLPGGLIMAPLNYGPELLYFTDHSVVSGPYHRITSGITDTLDFFGDVDDQAARKILQRRNVRYVLSCPGDAGAKPVMERQTALALGRGVPDWLEPVRLPEGQDFRLYRVR